MAHVTLNIGEIETEIDAVSEAEVENIIENYDFTDIVKGALTNIPDRHIIDMDDLNTNAMNYVRDNMDWGDVATEVIGKLLANDNHMKQLAAAIAKHLTLSLTVEEE